MGNQFETAIDIPPGEETPGDCEITRFFRKLSKGDKDDDDSRDRETVKKRVGDFVQSIEKGDSEALLEIIQEKILNVKDLVSNPMANLRLEQRLMMMGDLQDHYSVVIKVLNEDDWDREWGFTPLSYLLSLKTGVQNHVLRALAKREEYPDLPLLQASKVGNFAIIRKLVLMGKANVNMKLQKTGDTVGHFLCRFLERTKIEQKQNDEYVNKAIQFLLDQGYNPTLKNDKEETVLGMLSDKKFVERINTMIEERKIDVTTEPIIYREMAKLSEEDRALLNNMDEDEDDEDYANKYEPRSLRMVRAPIQTVMRTSFLELDGKDVFLSFPDAPEDGIERMNYFFKMEEEGFKRIAEITRLEEAYEVVSSFQGIVPIDLSNPEEEEEKLEFALKKEFSSTDKNIFTVTIDMENGLLGKNISLQSKYEMALVKRFIQDKITELQKVIREVRVKNFMEKIRREEGELRLILEKMIYLDQEVGGLHRRALEALERKGWMKEGKDPKFQQSSLKFED